MCFSAFAEQESQFLWGVSPDEYIAAYGLTDYETNELNEHTTLITLTYTDTDEESLVFYDGQFVGTMYDYTGDDTARIDTLGQLLGNLVGEVNDGGAQRVYEIMNTVVAGLYTSADDFTECISATGTDGTFGAFCRYADSGYVLMIVNDTLLNELAVPKTAPIGAGPIGSGVNVNVAATAAPESPIGGGPIGSDVTVSSTPTAAPASSVGGGFNVGGGLNTNTGNSGNETATEPIPESTPEAVSTDYPWGMSTDEFGDFMELDNRDVLPLQANISCMYRYNTDDEYEMWLFADDKLAATILEFYSEEDTDPSNLLAMFEDRFGAYSEADPAYVADIMNTLLPLDMTDDQLSSVYSAAVGDGVYAYCFLYDGCADILVVNEPMIK